MGTIWWLRERQPREGRCWVPSELLPPHPPRECERTEGKDVENVWKRVVLLKGCGTQVNQDRRQDDRDGCKEETGEPARVGGVHPPPHRKVASGNRSFGKKTGL